MVAEQKRVVANDRGVGKGVLEERGERGRKALQNGGGQILPAANDLLRGEGEGIPFRNYTGYVLGKGGPDVLGREVFLGSRGDENGKTLSRTNQLMTRLRGKSAKAQSWAEQREGGRTWRSEDEVFPKRTDP